MTKKRKATSGSSGDSGGMLMILSPAKTLDLSALDKDDPLPWTVPQCSPTNIKKVSTAMKAHAQENKLSKLLGLSANLTKTATEYWKAFDEASVDSIASNSKPCGFAFSGAAYQGLQIQDLDKPSLEYLQEHLRIVDPVYGWLRPMDAIQPYRLEMASRNILPKKGNEKSITLANFWRPAIQESLLKTETAKMILNLASDEYSSAVNPPEGIEMIKVIFRHEGRVIAVHAKRARGLMARYLAENRVDSLEGAKEFQEEGYTFQPEDSDDATTIVFDRKKDWNEATTKAKQSRRK
jgi:cytoplasmic iron level regulating protein YaaA (DUF328/UPF0246 family)